MSGKARNPYSSENASHQFSQVPRVGLQRSKFDRSFGMKTTFNSGYLVPIFVDEVLPPSPSLYLSLSLSLSLSNSPSPSLPWLIHYSLSLFSPLLSSSLLSPPFFPLPPRALTST